MPIHLCPPFWSQRTGPGDGEIPVTMSHSLVLAMVLVLVPHQVTPQSPCSPSPCGLRAQCEVQSGTNAICSCPRGYTGDPFTRCDPFSSSSSSSGGCRSCQSSAVSPVRGGASGGGFGSSGSGSMSSTEASPKYVSRPRRLMPSYAPGSRDAWQVGGGW